MTAATDTPRALPRLKERYRAEIVPALKEQFTYANPMQIPGLVKIVVNMGVGEAARDSKLMDGAVRDLTAITGQKPLVRRATKSIALPRIRDFRGLSPKQFDGSGNYTFGLNEQSVFHEIDVDNIDRPRGMDITVVTSATNDDEGRALSATTPSGSPSSRCSTRSTWTRSTGSAAWTSTSSPRRRMTTKGERYCGLSAFRSRRTE